MKSYGAARFLLWVLVWAGWGVMILGGGMVIIFASRAALGQGSETIVVLGLVVTTSVGLFMIGIAQMGLASLDTAENTGAILRHLKSNGDFEASRSTGSGLRREGKITGGMPDRTKIKN